MGLLWFTLQHVKESALCVKSHALAHPTPLNSRQSPISGINRHPGAFTHACYGSGAF